MGMFDELSGERAAQTAWTSDRAELEGRAAQTFAASMDQLAPEYAQTAQKMRIATRKVDGRLLAKRGWAPTFKRGSTCREHIGGDIPRDDPCRKSRFGKELVEPVLYIYPNGTWGWVAPGKGAISRPQRMIGSGYDYAKMREQLMGDLRERSGLR